MYGKRTASAGLILVLAACMLTLTAGSASALTSAESKFVSLINKERSARGRQPLQVASDLVSNARTHSDRMAAKGEIFHNSNLSKQISNWFVLGENVGMGPDVGSLHKAFMNSTHHRENILYRDYNRIGVGITVDDDGYIFVTEVFAGRRTASTRTTVARTSATTRSITPSVTPAPSKKVTPPAPAKKRAAPAAAPQTVDLLVRMVGLDAASVDPSTGAASTT